MKTFHQLALSWGVYPVLAIQQNSTDKLFQHAIDCAKTLDLVEKGDLVVISGGEPVGASGNTNMIKAVTVAGND